MVENCENFNNIEDVEKGLILLKEVENRHQDLIFVRDKILKIYETWNNLNKFSKEIQTTHSQIIDDLKISLNYLTQANDDTKKTFTEIKKKRKYLVLIFFTIFILILLFFISAFYSMFFS